MSYQNLVIMFKVIEQCAQLGGYIQTFHANVQHCRDYSTKKLQDEGFTVTCYDINWCKATHGRALIAKNIAFDYWRGKVKSACYECAVRGETYMKNPFDVGIYLDPNGKGMYELDGFQVDIGGERILGFSWENATTGTAYRLCQIAHNAKLENIQ